MNNFASICLILCSIMLFSCGNSSNKEEGGPTSEIATEKRGALYTDSRIKYDASIAVTGWVALYDKNMGKRCYMTHDDYYSIKEPNMNGNLIAEYSFLVPLGMVLKYSGAHIIWGFDGVESVNWNDANEYVESYSPDGKTWRLLSKVEASAIKSNIYNFVKNFGKYYPNDLSYHGAYLHINTWTSGISDEVWIRKSDNKAYNKIYTLDIHHEDAKIVNEFTTYEKDSHNVYPISSL